MTRGEFVVFAITAFVVLLAGLLFLGLLWAFGGLGFGMMGPGMMGGCCGGYGWLLLCLVPLGLLAVLLLVGGVIWQVLRQNRVR